MRYLSLPHEPELKDIDVPPTLDGLVSGVVRHVVMLVGLEEILGALLIACLQQTLTLTHSWVNHLIQSVTQVSNKCELTDLLSHQDGGTLQRGAHHLVGIPGDGRSPEEIQNNR